jgi:hypothetical protein
MRFGKQITVAALLGVGFVSSEAHATSIPIANASFEALQFANPPLFAPTIPSWTVGGPPEPFQNAGTGQTNAGQYPGGIPDGVNYAFINNGFISQTLTTALASSTTYTLGFFVGHRLDEGTDNYIVELLAGSTVLASVNTPLIPSPGTFGQATLTFTSTANDPLAGQLLGIEFESGTDQADFDLVTLDAVSDAPATVPEPATLAMFGFGLAGLGLIRRHR